MINIYPSSDSYSTSGFGRSSATTLTSNPQGSNSAAAAPTDTLLNKLAENIPGMDADGLRSLKAEDFTPEKVADRISGFVASGLEAARARGASEERLQSMYEAAVSGVKKGFEDAREILDNLQLLDGELAEQVKQTETLTFEALDALAPGTDEVSGAMATRKSIIERFQNAEDMELNVTTRDGDEVRITFSRNQSYESAYASASDGKGNSASVFSLSRSEYSEYSFSVSGDLDVDEAEALQSLIKDVSSLADEFFDGDVQKAFEQSKSLSFDTSELASMSLDMSYSRQYAAASSYEQVGQIDQAGDKPGRRLGHLMKGMAESFNAPSLGFLTSPGQLGRSLMEGLVNQDARYSEAPEAQQDIYDNNLLALLDAVLPAEEVEVADNQPQTDTSSES
ncbi:DUF5610 domain-containing protein [Marinobacterium lutimaris]|uniref:DUF5610 domain-containing protein n=1 Tax=Marinobacterium lutimaris TaxID=568106 RepID=A0A1H5ZBQ6_9GAMM|nr:DUF5610 domain-containing protein [Marinobacterium lutimaris]SEG33460.1 hypothetical protein SAMN05444390_1012093 [Marinobacterium lutimaris]